MAAVKVTGVRDFYRNKAILLTGCTGFLGTALVEKLLRSFPDIGKLYLIARSRGGKSVHQRGSDYFKDEVFSRMKSENPAYLSKIEWIEGDLDKPNLGINTKDVDRIKNSVNVVLHNGATIKFMDPLKNTLQTNCKSTMDLLNLSKEIKNIECFLYVSTAYSNITQTRSYVEEKLYPHPIQPKKLMEMMKQDAVLDFKMIAPWPTSYAYSKSAAENLCAEYTNYFPLGVFRPGGILSSYEEPFAYWLKSVAGFGGYLKFMHKGTKKLFYTNPLSMSNTVPVDMTANALIANVYDVATKKGNCVPIMNFTSNNNPCSWEQAMKYSLENTSENEKYGLIPNPSCAAIYNEHLYNLLTFLKERVPAHYNDFILNLQGKKRKYVKDNNNLNALVGVLKYAMIGNYRWENNYSERLFKELSKDEQKLLNFNINEIDWRTYYRNIIIESQKVYHNNSLK